MTTIDIDPLVEVLLANMIVSGRITRRTDAAVEHCQRIARRIRAVIAAST